MKDVQDQVGAVLAVVVQAFEKGWRRWRKVVFIDGLISLLSISLAYAGDTAPRSNLKDPRDWSATLKSDALAFHKTILDNHPGPYDALNPHFRLRLEQGLTLALHRTSRVHDAGGWWWAMRAFVASFDDGHVQIRMSDLSNAFSMRWPGFLTVYRGGDQIVADRIETDATLPPRGARLLSCDGVSAKRLAQERIGEFRGRWFLQSQRILFGDWLFLSGSNPWIREMRTCRFETQGRVRAYRLKWRDAVGDDLAVRRARLSTRSSPEFGVRALEDGGYWISMPAFDGAPDSQAYQALTALLKQTRTLQALLRSAPYVVLDVRGNSGGSSQWSNDLAQVLWGRAWVSAHRPAVASAVDWRVSDRNLSEIEAFLSAQNAASDSNPEIVQWAKTVVKGLTEARAAGKIYWHSSNATASPQTLAANLSNPVAGKVFILTDPICASACLDAVDLWKSLSAIQIGGETSADTVYMEIREEVLPSGLAVVGVPMKVYRGRNRGNNEPQRPSHIFYGDMSDDQALRAWVRSLVPR